MLNARPILLLAFLLGLAMPQAAGAQSFSSDYVVSLIGIPIGRASFQTSIGRGDYSVSGTLGSSGLGSLVSRTDGTSSVAGRIRGGALQAERYRLAYTSDGRSWSSDVRMSGGRVRSSTVAPQREGPRPTDYVPVAQGHLRSVVDPLSGVMIRAEASEVCNRSLPLYDGWSRLDLRLSPAGTRRFSATGFSGQAVVCHARIAPVSGYRRGSKGLNFLQGQTIQLWFAPLGETGIFAPVYARVPTQIGPLSLTATRFGAR
ncbi:DUF3108 domain-containing protein [Aureimonas populi]|uniref:DUF3108 domain-containing protein n=1 Tax=Aureimonas populi TaxID=1701758 RepID=A0ABW5CHA2_9HYPH|nr:DUF3108 domain-containing protein [Aureimonas populi]